MFIQTEITPNPETIKFLPGQRILEAGTYNFPTREEASVSPLGIRLFGLQGVAGVFITPDYVSVTKRSDTDWSMLKPMILESLMEHLSLGLPILTEDFLHSGKDGENQKVEEDPISRQIRELLDARVRPMVAMDGGDIVFDRFENGVVYLAMRGACSGCPSSTATLKMGVERLLRHYIPEVTDVRAVPGD